MKRVRDAISIVAAAFREIFDESAYARFLDRTRKLHSREAYAEFLREIELKKRSAPKCC
jgi:hypothetical protein